MISSAITNAIRSTADIVVGKSRHTRPNSGVYPEPFWNGHLEALRNKKLTIKRELKAKIQKRKNWKTSGNGKPARLDALETKIRKVSEELRAAQKKFDRMLCSCKAQYDRRCVEKVRSTKTSKPFFDMIKERPEQLEVSKLEYLDEVCVVKEDMERLLGRYWGEEVFASKNPDVPFPSEKGRFGQILMAVPTMEEVARVIEKMKNGKAGGPDEIVSDFVKQGGQTLMYAMRELFEIVIRTKIPPRDWSSMIISLIPKKGSIELVTNTRPLALTGQVYKGFMGMVNERLTDVAEQNGWLGQLQNGFRAGRGTSDNLVILSHVIEHSRTKNKPLYVGFLDLEKAYDSVEWPVLWDTLGRLDIDRGFIEMLRNVYKNSECTIKLGQLTAQGIPIRRGVKQGCKLSPMLFALMMSRLTRMLEKLEIGAEFALGKLPGLLYADDLVLCANSHQELQQLLTFTYEFSQTVGMKFNPPKCKVVHFPSSGQTAGKRSNGAHLQFMIGKDEIETANSYTYLGVQFCNSKNYLEVFESRILNRANYYVNEIRCRAQASFSKYWVGRELWKAQAVPALTYALDCFKIRKAVVDKLESVQRKMAREILQAPSYAANEALLGECGWSEFGTRIRRSRIGLAYRLLNGPNAIARGIMQTGTGAWLRQVHSDAAYFRLDLQASPLHATARNAWIRRHADVVETEKWQHQMSLKPTLSEYKLCSTISDKRALYVSNGAGSKHLFAFRAGCVATNDRVAKFKRDKVMFGNMCGVCEKWKVETQSHIMLECEGYADLKWKWIERMKKLDTSLENASLETIALRGLQLDVEGCHFNNQIAEATKRYLRAVMTRRARLTKLKIVEIARRMCAYTLCLGVGVLCTLNANIP